MRTPQAEKVRWSERMIARALAVQVFDKKYLVVVPNCTWTGDEIDVLAVTPDLRLVDVEVKISRADLKADAKKERWVKPLPYDEYWARKTALRAGRPVAPRERLEWPRSIWKHYYAFPQELWNADIAAHIDKHTPRSGVILMTRRDDSHVHAHIERRSQPCRDAKAISAADAVCLARLASLRMWDAYVELNKLKEKTK